MPQPTQKKIIQKVSELSLNIKATMIVFLGALLLTLNNLIDNNLSEIVFNVIFLVCFTSLLYIDAFFQKKYRQKSKKQLSQALTNKTLPEYVQSLPKNEKNEVIHLLCNNLDESQRHTENQKQEVKELTKVTEHLAICMEIINDSMEEELGQIEQLVIAMNEMTATVTEVSHNANSASASTSETSTVAQEGCDFIDATISSINSLSSNIDSSSNALNNVELKVAGIGSAVDTIRSISEQTNLLALNAAIEAARAGEAGRGFSVVASEVRTLAKRTQDATVEIQSMIEQLQKSAQDAVNLMGKSVQEADVGVNLATQAGSKLSGMVRKVKHISEMNIQIASAAEQQTTVTSKINESLEQVKEVVEGSMTVFNEVTDMANDIHNHAKVLALYKLSE